MKEKYLRMSLTGLILALSSILFCGFIFIKKKSATKQKKEPVIVMFGDSITKGGNWTELLGRTDVINAGFPGFTTSHLVWLMKKNVIDLRPQICFLEGGINDIGVGIPLKRTKENYKNMIDVLLDNDIVPVVQSVLYQKDNPQSKIQVDSVNQYLLAYCNSKSVKYLDLNAKLSTSKGLKEEFTSDGTHLKSNAYAIWGQELKTLLSSMEPLSKVSFKPGKIWRDNNRVHINAHGGGILFHENTYYWYGEHKVEGEIGNTAQVGVHVYSSKDLYNWTDENIALKVDSNNPESDIAKGCIIERPKVLYNKKTKKFVMWFHLELLNKGYDSARSGIAISDRPTGPFKYVKSVRPNKEKWPINVQKFHKEKITDAVKPHYCGGYGCMDKHVDSLNILGRDFKKGQMARDMNLFVDNDGKAYQIYSSEENSTLHIAELNADYLDYSGKYVRVFPNRYMEAPAIFKTSKGKYYLIASDCTGWAPNAARSAMSDRIFGPWKELGNPCVGTDHELTFHSQSTFILPVPGKKDEFIYMGDRWAPKNPIDGRYVWLPLQIVDGKPILRWKDEWF